MNRLILVPNSNKLLRLSFLITVFIFSFSSVSHTKNVSLTWDPNQDSDIAGYKVYYGTKTSTYDGMTALEGISPIDIGTSTSINFVGLEDNQAHYFAVTAYNFNGLESSYSNEVISPGWTNNDYDGDGYDFSVDCDDYNSQIYPSATEISDNGIDENCNGMKDDTLEDTTAPWIHAMTPSDGSVLKGRWCRIEVEAVDNQAVTKTEIYIDGKLALSTPTNVAQMKLDSKTISKGNHIVLVKAYDQANNMGVHTIRVVK